MIFISEINNIKDRIIAIIATGWVAEIAARKK